MAAPQPRSPHDASPVAGPLCRLAPSGLRVLTHLTRREGRAAPAARLLRLTPAWARPGRREGGEGAWAAGGAAEDVTAVRLGGGGVRLVPCPAAGAPGGPRRA